VDFSITPDNIVYWAWGPITLNATIVFSWLVMAILVAGSWLITRNLSAELEISHWQSLLEMLVLTIRDQIRQVADQEPARYLPFIGTLFLFISVSNLLSIVPGYQTPTGSLSTTLALAVCVFFAVPIYGIAQRGVLGYLKHYVQPSPILLPFHIISEVSRTFALAVRLFGNVMSGGIIVGILVSIIPLFLPVVLEAFELLIGQIQAYSLTC
jgi:F-type H+-transporting ATPase subunit a